MPIRSQLPVYSPLPLSAVVRGVTASLLGLDGRPQLTRLLTERYGSTRVILTGSGTQALQAALTWAARENRLGAGVALPAFSCFDLVSAAVGADVPIILYDLDPRTLSPDPESVADAMHRGAGTVVVAPLYGFPVDWGTIVPLIRERGGFLVEDLAQAFGLDRQPKGELAVLSFGRGKGWTAGRGGALLVSPNADLAAPAPTLLPERRLASRLALPTRIAAQWALGRPNVYGIPAALPWLALGETVYHPPIPTTQMEPGAAALAAATLESSQTEISRRRAAAVRLLRGIGGNPHVSPVVAATNEIPTYLRLPVRIAPDRWGMLLRSGGKAAGIMRSYPVTLGSLSVARQRLLDPRPLAGADELARTLVTLPAHSRLTESDLGRLERLLEGIR